MSWKPIDLDQWSRKDHFEFFKGFDEPFFGVTFNVKVTGGYQYCKVQEYSFFVYYLYATLKAVNEVEALRSRIIDGKPVVFDQVSISPTIKREDGSFGFSYMEYRESFHSFYGIAQKEIARVSKGNNLVPSGDNVGTVHFSALPWLRFTSLSHARNYKDNDSIPKISVGQLFRDSDQWMMPVSVHVNHALADGLHVGQYAEAFEVLMNKEY